MHTTDMEDLYADRRTHKRFFFSANESLVAHITFPSSDLLPIDAIVLNISRGGLGLALAREFHNDMVNGTATALNRLSVSSSERPRSITPEHPIPMTIRWLVSAPYLDHIGFGCEFNTIEDNTFAEFQSFIDMALPGRISIR